MVRSVHLALIVFSDERLEITIHRDSHFEDSYTKILRYIYIFVCRYVRCLYNPEDCLYK